MSKRTSQNMGAPGGGVYLNPGATGVGTNVPLNNPASATAAPSTAQGNLPQLALALQKVISPETPEMSLPSLSPYFKTWVASMPPESPLMPALRSFADSLMFNANPRKLKPGQLTPKQMASNLLQQIQTMQSMPKPGGIPNNLPNTPLANAGMALTQGLNAMNNPQLQQQQTAQPAQAMPQRTAQVVKKKKKTRGNPFKVLMGKAGKLLDNGLSKQQIVRYLDKQKYWNRETIEKAVDIVKDYNKKKHAKAVSELKRLITAEIEEFEHINKELEGMSDAELVFRAAFLKADLDGIDLGMTIKNPRKEFNAINSLLKQRGLDV